MPCFTSDTTLENPELLNLFSLYLKNYNIHEIILLDDAVKINDV